MKKVFAFVLTLALMLSFATAFFVSSSAKAEYVEENYTYNVALEFGPQGGSLHGTKLPEGKNYIEGIEPTFNDGRWAYEYGDRSKADLSGNVYNEKNKIVKAYQETQPVFNYMNYYPITPAPDTNNFANFYGISHAAASDTNHVFNYCMIRATGVEFHPGIAADAVIAFIVPATGKISFRTSFHMTGAWNSDENVASNQHAANGGCYSLYLNNDRVVGETTITSTNGKVEIEKTLSVKEGDRVRFCWGSNGEKSADTCRFDDFPSVTYLEAKVPIGNPKGVAPENLDLDGKVNEDSLTLVWDAAKGAASYNVYQNGEKVAEGLKETKYAATGLTAGTLYEFKVTSVGANGTESDFSEAFPIKTKAIAKEPEKTSDKPADKPDKTDTPAASDATGNANDTPAASVTGLSTGALVGIIIGCVFGGILIAAAAGVVVFLLLKKKKNNR